MVWTGELNRVTAVARLCSSNRRLRGRDNAQFYPQVSIICHDRIRVESFGRVAHLESLFEMSWVPSILSTRATVIRDQHDIAKQGEL